ncbi:hypothetical protein [Anaerobacillus alkalilacustris]|nr:hypothetical protein [Anaerobacillus alkalilacustris]
MGIGLIVLGVITFFLGALTPINLMYTLPTSIIMIVFGIMRLVKK